MVLMSLFWGLLSYATDSLAPYAGRYQLPDQTVLTINLEQSKLVGTLPNRPSFRLKAFGPDRFVLESVPVRIVFLRNQTGAIYALELRQPLTDSVAKKLSKPSTQRPTRQRPSAVPLDLYLGNYAIGGVFVTQVKNVNGQLVYKPPGREIYKLEPLSKHVFEAENNALKIEFIFGDESKPASRIVVHQDGKKRIFYRATF